MDKQYIDGIIWLVNGLKWYSKKNILSISHSSPLMPTMNQVFFGLGKDQSSTPPPPCRMSFLREMGLGNQGKVDIESLKHGGKNQHVALY
jgi:hypothetical protein